MTYNSSGSRLAGNVPTYAVPGACTVVQHYCCTNPLAYIQRGRVREHIYRERVMGFPRTSALPL